MHKSGTYVDTCPQYIINLLLQEACFVNIHKQAKTGLYFIVLGLTFLLCYLFIHLPTADPLPSWNNGYAKKAIIDFVTSTTSEGNLEFVPLDDRIATFDQDGTLWVEQPIYTQLLYCLDRVAEIVKTKPELKNTEPFQTVLSGGPKAIENLSLSDIEKIAAATMTGMSVEAFEQEVRQWIKTAKNQRWNRLYTEMTYQPMQEVMQYLRANGYKTYIVTGGGQDFVRVYAQEIYGVPPEQVIGTATGLNFSYDKAGKPILTKEPTIVLNNNNDGKPEAIHLIIGRRPRAAFGNSEGDRQMLEYCHSGHGNRLVMLVLHDDPIREYAYGPAQGLPNSKIGTFTQALYDEAKKNNWLIISMKNDWKHIFSFEASSE